MTGIWTWLKDEGNRKVVGWLFASLGGFGIYFGFFKPEEKKPPVVAVPAAVAPTATAAPAPASNASTNASSNANTAQSPAVLPSGNQSAVATGGTAINASGNAQVNVKP